MEKMLNWLADVDTRLKVIAFFLVFSVLPAGLLLLVLDHHGAKEILPLAGLYLVVMVLVQFPLCAFFSHILVARNIQKINAYCKKLKQGDYNAAFHLPPEKGEENDFIRAKRNLFWMGQIIASREQKLVDAHDALNDARMKLVESIEYASGIQHAMLPPGSLMASVVDDHFIWWAPRDVVGGDTYWVTETPSGYLVAVIDCTGHGVPGAFMTLIVYGLMEQCLGGKADADPSAILGRMNRDLKRFLHQGDAPDQLDNGFDAAVCHIASEFDRMTFTGAGIPLLYESNGVIHEIKGDRVGVGDRRASSDMVYTRHHIDLTKASRFYLATDGFRDQIGGPHRIPFGKARLKRLLGRVYPLPFAQQKEALSAKWRAYAGGEEKRDDLTVLGFACHRPKEKK